MLREAFVNLMIMVAFISMGGHLFRNEEITENSPLRLKLAFGAVGGILGSILVLFAINVSPDVNHNIFLDYL